MADKALLQKLATLSQLHLAEGEAEQVARELPLLVAFADELPGLSAAPSDRWQQSPVQPALRPDEPQPGLSRQAVLQGAAARDEETILVPKTVG